MSEREAGEELRDIARQARRHLEREVAAGHGEVLMRALSAARAKLAAPATAGTTSPAAAAGAPSAPATTPTRVASSAPAATSEPVSNLFGEVPKPTRAPVAVTESLPLPAVHGPLHPIGAAREAIYSASLPVLEAVASEARACRKCGLCETRTKAVPGVGSARTGIVFVGEAPGADEDAQGEPFVGRAGQLLTQMIRAMDDKQLIPGVKLSRETVYICNVLKCRPPENRNPLPNEIEMCSPYLMRQLDAIKPRIICCLGKFAGELLVGVKGTIAGMRGKTYRYRGAKLIVTYHPAALLRNPNWKGAAWEDLKRLALEYQTESPAA